MLSIPAKSQTIAFLPEARTGCSRSQEGIGTRRRKSGSQIVGEVEGSERPCGGACDCQGCRVSPGREVGRGRGFCVGVPRKSDERVRG